MYQKWIDLEGESFYRVYFSLDDIIDSSIDIAKQYAEKFDKSKTITLLYLRNGGTFGGELLAHIFENMGYKVNVFSIGIKNNSINNISGDAIDFYKPLAYHEQENFVRGMINGNNLLIVDEVVDSGESYRIALDYLNNNLKLEDQDHKLDYLERIGSTQADLYFNMLNMHSLGAVLDRKPKFYLESVPDYLKAFVAFNVHAFNPGDPRDPILDMNPIGKDPYKHLWTVYPWEEEAKEVDGYYEKELEDMIYGKHNGSNPDIWGMRDYIQKSQKIIEKVSQLKIAI